MVQLTTGNWYAHCKIYFQVILVRRSMNEVQLKPFFLVQLFHHFSLLFQRAIVWDVKKGKKHAELGWESPAGVKYAFKVKITIHTLVFDHRSYHPYNA